MKMLKLMFISLFVPCFYCLHDHGMVGAALLAWEFLVVNMIEKWDRGIVYWPIILKLIGSPLVWLGGDGVGGSYVTIGLPIAARITTGRY
jgi:hypothetical protein